MKKTIKKIIEVILTIIACISFVLMFGERPDGSANLPWTFGWMAALAICAKILEKMGVFGKSETL
jgi:hypothetical protein